MKVMDLCKFKELKMQANQFLKGNRGSYSLEFLTTLIIYILIELLINYNTKGLVQICLSIAILLIV